MRILLIAFEYPPMVGGGSTYNKNLAKALIKQGAKVCVITGGDADEDTTSDKVFVKKYKCFFKGNKGQLNIYDGIDVLIENIKNFKPDVIHTLHYTENLLAQVANVNFHLPLVATLNRTPDSPTKKINQNGKWSLYDFASNHFTDHMIMISKFTRRRLLETSIGISSSNVEVIYPGIDRKDFNPKKDAKKILRFRKKLGLTRDDLLILAPIVIRKRKGIDFLCKSIDKFARETSKSVKLIITGANIKDQKTIKDIQMLLGEDKLIIHKGFNNDEMPLLYKSSDVTILSSESEGLGIALIEAMMCGCPVVASDIPGINEVIKNKYNGELVEYGNCIAMVKAIKKITNSKYTKNKYIQNGISTTKRKFNLEIQGEKHIKVYKKLIKYKVLKVFSIPFFKNGRKFLILLHKNGSRYSLIKCSIINGQTIMDTSIKTLKKLTGLYTIQPYYHFQMDNYNQYIYI